MVTVKNQEVIEYYHRGVACHLVGLEIALPLDVELILPGEGEVIAAKRLLDRVIQHYGRFFDGIVQMPCIWKRPSLIFVWIMESMSPR
jgi:hypothetical protein